MIELLRRAAQSAPDNPVLITPTGETGYAALLDGAHRAAAGLAARNITRFGVVSADSRTALTLCAAASLLGAEACVYPTDASPDLVRTLAERLDHDILIGVGAKAAEVGAIDLGELGSEATEEDLRSLAAREVPHQPDSRPHLILTSGTTGVPRGVRQDWARLLKSSLPLPPAPDQRWLLAYSMHQFGCLQVVLYACAAGACLVDPVVRRPHEGLVMMREQGVTHASGTPTFWRLVLAEARADRGPVPPLRQITLGGEVVPQKLLADLAAAFPTARISHIYGATEFGNFGTVRDGEPGLPAALLDRGDDADIRFKIVDGELWTRSKVASSGYYGESEISDPTAWRPTGDLVELVGDRIMFRGRRTEIINVGGTKVDPHPIEARVADIESVAIARVYGRKNPVTGQIVAIDVKPVEGADPEHVREAVRDACADLPPAQRPRLIKIVDDLVTNENKIVRRADQ